MSQNQTKPRAWLVNAEPIVIDGEQHDVLYEELAECIMLLRRVGGAMTVQTTEGNLVIGAIREQSDDYPDLYLTKAFAFKWTPSVPTARRVRPEPPLAHEEPEDEMRDQDEAEIAAELEPAEA